MARHGVRGRTGSVARLYQDRLSAVGRSVLLFNRSAGLAGRSRCQNVDRLLDGIDGALGVARAMRDQVAGSVEIGPADLTDTRRDEQGWRIAGKAQTGDSGLREGGSIDHYRGGARPCPAPD